MTTELPAALPRGQLGRQDCGRENPSTALPWERLQPSSAHVAGEIGRFERGWRGSRGGCSWGRRLEGTSKGPRSGIATARLRGDLPFLEPTCLGTALPTPHGEWIPARSQASSRIGLSSASPSATKAPLAVLPYHIHPPPAQAVRWQACRDYAGGARQKPHDGALVAGCQSLGACAGGMGKPSEEAAMEGDMG